MLGNKVETQITKLINENNKILRFGIAFEFPDARIRVSKKLEDNLDECKDIYFIHFTEYYCRTFNTHLLFRKIWLNKLTKSFKNFYPVLLKKLQNYESVSSKLGMGIYRLLYI